MNLSGRICAMLRYRPWQYTKYSLRALPCLTQIRLGNLSQRLIGEEYKSQFHGKQPEKYESLVNSMADMLYCIKSETMACSGA
jgi:hypothetical protein